MTWRTSPRTYATEQDAWAVAAVLEDFEIRARVMGPIRVGVLDSSGLEAGTVEHWEVSVVVPEELAHAPRAVGPPVEIDENDRVSSAWDWEAEDRRDRHREFD